ncbi:MAG TPA: hypothetical protein VN868_05785 [Terriglobales bacterium]|jgi:hypothetical protein|nr:hypothetical protein [Terriglobales bacterium]
MTDTRTERGTCRFMAEKGEDGKPIIRVELFHNTVSVLNHATLAFNLLSGISLERAKKIADSLNENVLDASVKLSSQHPMFAPSKS